jgi:hypothetical protein
MNLKIKRTRGHHMQGADVSENVVKVFINQGFAGIILPILISRGWEVFTDLRHLFPTFPVPKISGENPK